MHCVPGKQEGQAMIVTTLLTSGLILVATTVAGFLVSMQIRQAADVALSAQAIFAADAGIESSLYCYRRQFYPGSSPESDPEDPLNLNSACSKNSEKFSDLFPGALPSRYFTTLFFEGTLEDPMGFTVWSEGIAGVRGSGERGEARRVLQTRFEIES